MKSELSPYKVNSKLENISTDQENIFPNKIKQNSKSNILVHSSRTSMDMNYTKLDSKQILEMRSIPVMMSSLRRDCIKNNLRSYSAKRDDFETEKACEDWGQASSYPPNH